MTWFKVDDSFHSHPKALAAEPAALGLWVLAGSWCSSNLTDGFVPDYVLPRLLPDSAELARKLVVAGLWTRTKGGYRFHDWGDYNPTAEDVKAEREAARNRMRALRQKQAANRVTAGDDPERSPEQPANVREKFAVGSQPRPDPTRSSSKEELSPQASPSGGAAKRGTRLPADFAITDEMRRWAKTQCPLADADYETEQFKGYWRSKVKDNTKLDWELTWKNWMRKAQKDADTRRKPATNNRLTGSDSRDGAIDWDDPRILEFR